MSLILVDHEASPWQEWRPGVKVRTWGSALHGANGLHMGEQICEPGTGAPYHWHYYEEFITVLDGVAEVKVNGETAIVEARGTLIVPPRAFHGFTNVGDGLLTVLGVTDWPIMDTGYAEDEDGIVVRGWEPGIETRRRLVEEGTAR